MTGFTGSAGLVVVTNTDVALLTDTRYTLQAKRELSKEWKIIDDGCSSLESIQKLQLLINLPIRSNIAIDSKYISHQISKRLRSHFKSFLIDLYFTDVSFIDIVWFDRPCPPSNPIFCYDSVVKADQKITMVRDVLAKKNIFFHVVTELDNIACKSKIFHYLFCENQIIYNKGHSRLSGLIWPFWKNRLTLPPIMCYT